MYKNRLKELRRQNGIRQVDLAERLGISQAMVSQLESDTRQGTPDLMMSLARELSVPVEELVDEPPLFTRLIRNCKGLNIEQLELLNQLALQFRTRHIADRTRHIAS